MRELALQQSAKSKDLQLAIDTDEEIASSVQNTADDELKDSERSASLTTSVDDEEVEVEEEIEVEEEAEEEQEEEETVTTETEQGLPTMLLWLSD